MIDPFAESRINALGLEPHPEGGFFREIFRSTAQVAPQDGRGLRSAITEIYFLLPSGIESAWHRVDSDELWHYVEGAALHLWIAPRPDDSTIAQSIGPLVDGASPIGIVPKGMWQKARSTGAYTLVTCSVGPGFDFADFHLR